MNFAFHPEAEDEFRDDAADAARIRVAKFYRKGAAPRTAKKLDEPAASPPPPSTQESVTERLLREAEDQQPVEQSPSCTTYRSGRSPTLQGTDLKGFGRVQ